MKIKQSPDDFRVEEVTEVQPSGGAFSLYQMAKQGWTTHDVVRAIRRVWQLPAASLSYGGLKDRHADTTQYVTIRDGPERLLSGPGWTLTYLGRVPRPFTSSDIRANRFVIVVRALSAEVASAAVANLQAIAATGLVNYFDDQRFGSVSADGDFVARRMVLGDWEGALRIALASPYEFDRAADKRIKSSLRHLWGRWATLKDQLPRCHARSIVDYLTRHPGDFKGAVARLRHDLLSLYLSAYQSHLWNLLAASWIRSRLSAEQIVEVRFKRHYLPMPCREDGPAGEAFASAVLPLPSARLKIDGSLAQISADWPQLLRQVLAGEGIELRQLTLRGVRRPFFSKGERQVLVHPRNLTGEAFADDRHPGRFAVRLRFEMPRGSYATLLVKRLFATK